MESRDAYLQMQWPVTVAAAAAGSAKFMRPSPEREEQKVVPQPDFSKLCYFLMQFVFVFCLPPPVKTTREPVAAGMVPSLYKSTVVSHNYKRNGDS